MGFIAAACDSEVAKIDNIVTSIVFVSTYLYQFVVASADDLELIKVRSDSHGRDPVRVSVGTLDGVEGVTDDVPDLDGLVTRARYDHTVVTGEIA